MHRIPSISGKELVKILEKNGFSVIRIKGSHFRLKSHDGKFTTIPVHGNKELPQGLLRKIITIDLEITVEKFLEIYSNFKN